MTKIAKINLHDPDPLLKKGASLIRDGKIIIYPTDTLYGIGADIFNEEAIEKLFRIKKRESGKPILILVENPGEIASLVKKVPSSALRLIEQYWPGPVTLVFEASATLPARLTANTGKIGIRCTDSPLVRRLLFFTQGPITSTSANIANEPPCENAEEAEKMFGEQVDLILDAGPLVSEPSTVVDVTGEDIKIVRQGKTKIEKVKNEK